MGTFHDNMGDLHGITVLIRHDDGTLYIGRCHKNSDEAIHLIKYDQFKVDDGPETERMAWLEKAQKWGVFPRYKSIQFTMDEVKSVTPLGQL